MNKKSNKDVNEDDSQSLLRNDRNPTSSCGYESVTLDQCDETTRLEPFHKTMTYKELLSSNRNFRFYWFSFVVNRLGDWLTLLASISLIQDAVGVAAPNYNTLVSALMVLKSLPNVIFMPLGGVLADCCDRRVVQIILNLLSALLLVLFTAAYTKRSIFLVYIANILQDSLTGLYTPSEGAMLPQLCSDENDELKKGTTLTSLTWSFMAAIGSALGGILVALFGVEGCFLIDSMTYLLAAGFLMHGVNGNFQVDEVATETEPLRRSSQLSRRSRRRSSLLSVLDGNILMGAGYESKLHQELEARLAVSVADVQETGSVTQLNVESGNSEMFVKGFLYAFVEEPLVGAYALLKGSMALATGAASILNVSFSEDEDSSLAALKLGSLFGFVGIGAILGTIICDTLADLSRPKSVAQMCIIGFGIIGMGCSLMAAAPSFGWICASTVLRTVGTSIIWTNSTLLIQNFTPPILLGRVNSIDTTAALLGDCISNLGGGWLMDRWGLAPEHLSWLLAIVGFSFMVLWAPLCFRSPTK